MADHVTVLYEDLDRVLISRRRLRHPSRSWQADYTGLCRQKPCAYLHFEGL